MYGLGWLFTFVRFIAENAGGRSQPVEPLIGSYEELSKGFATLTENLTSQISSLNRALAEAFKERKQLKKHYGTEYGKVKKEIDDCNKHRTELQDRVVKLEENARKEKNYTHDRVHEFENFIDFLEIDLTSAGIEPTAVAAILKRIRDRREAQYQQDSPSI